jgi:O-antigen/teichoic acid export membrane protein
MRRLVGAAASALFDRSLFRSSAIVFTGMAVARLLGFLFSVAAARLLTPANYGLLAYALAIATISSVLIGNAPTGLSRFVARHERDHRKQNTYFSNWMVVVGLMLGLSLALVVPLAKLAGLSAWLALGLAANLVGLAVLLTYRSAQIGLQRFGAMVTFYVVANALQLAGIVLAAAVGWRSPALFLTIYGLSSVGALAVMHPLAPVALQIAPASIAWRRVKGIIRFTRPIVLQTVLFAVWFGADLILVQRLLGPAKAGNYAAAKALVNVLILAPLAIASGLGPRVVRMSTSRLRVYLLRALLLTAGVGLPAQAVVVVWGRPLTNLLFGGKYQHAVEALGWLVLGMALYALYTILETAWVSLGRPMVDAVATGAGMLCTVGLGFALVRPLGLRGAAAAFAAGAGVQLGVIGWYSFRRLYRGTGCGC